jgi:hypothetical protein
MRRVLTAWQISCVTALSVVGSRACESRRWAHNSDEEDDELVRQLIQQSDIECLAVKKTSMKRTHQTVEEQSQVSPDVKQKLVPAEESLLSEPQVVDVGGPPVSAPPSNDPMQRASLYVRIRRATSGVLEWQCLLCSIYNHVMRTSCRGCGASSKQSQKDAQPTPARFVATMPSAWMCTTPSCSMINRYNEQSGGLLSQRERYRCKACRAPFQGIHNWICPICSAPNPRGISQCCGCYAQRPICWTCPTCKCATNCVFTVTCTSCSYERKPSSPRSCRCASCGAPALPGWELCSVCLAPLEHMRALLGGSTLHAPSNQPKRLEWNPIERTVEPASLQLIKVASTTSLEASDKVNVAASVSFVEDRQGAEQLRPEVLTSSAEASAATDAMPDSSIPRPSSIAVIRPLKVPCELKEYRTQDPSTSWKCLTCGLWCRFSTAFCDACLTPRSVAVAAGAVAPPPVVARRGADPGAGWKCHKCTAVNTLFSRVCVQCHSVRQVPQGYWQCATCNSVNRDSRIACLGCFGSRSAEKESVVVFTLMTGTSWTCLSCTFDGNELSALRCSSCQFDRNAWKCHCGRMNQVSHGACSSCGGQRTIGEKSSAALDWKCGDCGCISNNQTHSTICTQCGGSHCAPQALERWLWDCDLCHMINHSKDEVLPVVVQCSRCDRQAKSADVQKVRRTWKCTLCHTINLVGRDACTSCNARRNVQWTCTVECPTCRKSSIPSESEVCPHCNASLTAALSSMWSLLALESDDVKELKAQSAINASQESAGQQAAAFLRYFRDDGSPDENEEDGSDNEDAGARLEDSDAASAGDKPPPPIHHSINNATNGSQPLVKSSWSCALCGKTNDASFFNCCHCSMPKDV